MDGCVGFHLRTVQVSNLCTWPMSLQDFCEVVMSQLYTITAPSMAVVARTLSSLLHVHPSCSHCSGSLMYLRTLAELIRKQGGRYQLLDLTNQSRQSFLAEGHFFLCHSFIHSFIHLFLRSFIHSFHSLTALFSSLVKCTFSYCGSALHTPGITCQSKCIRSALWQLSPWTSVVEFGLSVVVHDTRTTHTYHFQKFRSVMCNA